MAHHNHAHHQHRRDRVGNAHQEVRRQDTVVNVVYVTASPTFTGKIGGYKTMDGSEEVQVPSPQPIPVAKTSAPVEKASPAVVQSSPAEQQQTSASTTPVAVVETTHQPESTSSLTQELAKVSQATSTAVTSEATTSEAVTSSSTSSKPVPKKAAESTSKSLSETLVPTPRETSSSSTLETSSAASSFNAQSASTSSPTAAPVTEKSSSGGMSGGAKAGLAIGILLAIGALAGLIFFCVRRRRTRRNEAYNKANDEKAAFGSGNAAAGLARSASVQTSATSRTAPRLSLRPVTQFLPDLAAQRKSGGNLLAVAGGPARHNVPTSSAADVEKAAAVDQTYNPANPFGNHAAVSEKTPVNNGPNDPTNPFGNHAEVSRQLTNAGPEAEIVPPAPLRIRTPSPDGKRATEAGALAGGAAGAIVAQRQDAPKPLNLSSDRAASPAMSNHLDGGMPSPAGTEFSMTPASPGSFPPGQPPSNVHRIQLDFKPSMDDELSLRAGQLVRLLHEYDDGWALCIRLDRSQQGVAPRSCLSARPVKPRPPPGARGPPLRGPPPPGMMNPNQQRPMSPASGRGSPSPYSQDPRANSPSPARGQRSMSPGPYGGGPQHSVIPTPGKRRSNSASAVRERRNSPPGPSPMNPNVQRVPMQIQAVTALGQDLATSPPQSVARKPVPGQAM